MVNSTAEILERHLARFGRRNLDAIMEDYAAITGDNIIPQSFAGKVTPEV